MNVRDARSSFNLPARALAPFLQNLDSRCHLGTANHTPQQDKP